MVDIKSLDDSKNIIAALLHDVHNVHGEVFNKSACKKTISKIFKRIDSEGTSFLTKTLPRLGKCFDKALAGVHPMNKASHGFRTEAGSELPRFLGELFSRVFSQDGEVLPDPCTLCVRTLRDVLYLFYKYELPYNDDQEQSVVSAFKSAEFDLSSRSSQWAEMHTSVERLTSTRRVRDENRDPGSPKVIREARILLSRVFQSFDCDNILPRHGPGAVATRQKLWNKYQWKDVSPNITRHYPLDEFFYSSLSHVCDRYQELSAVGTVDHPARVILVPKDSRGPRLISCEPVDYQWIQQGLGRAIVEHVESIPLTKWNVHFTDQEPNQRGALLGSMTGRYATLDLKEASDRVSLGLVRLLFPPHITERLEACRSSSTVLPDGEVLNLHKFAPMGSCLCFPILALTVWAILTSGAPDADTREGILVYGDDVIVPTAYAENAIEHLESFGLLVNRDKSCTKGSFRESCGMDAFKGVPVTPVRLRTVWSSTPSPSVFTSWIAYANSFWKRRYFTLYDLIVQNLFRVYGKIPAEDMNLSCPSLREVPEQHRPTVKRWNPHLQKWEFKVWTVKARSVTHQMDGWSMLLRYFTEGSKAVPHITRELTCDEYSRIDWRLAPEFLALKHNRQKSTHSSKALSELSNSDEPFSASSYTCRRESMLLRRWR
jgi:hypothetical protein